MNTMMGSTLHGEREAGVDERAEHEAHAGVGDARQRRRRARSCREEAGARPACAAAARRARAGARRPSRRVRHGTAAAADGERPRERTSTAKPSAATARRRPLAHACGASPRSAATSARVGRDGIVGARHRGDHRRRPRRPRRTARRRAHASIAADRHQRAAAPQARHLGQQRDAARARRRSPSSAVLEHRPERDVVDRLLARRARLLERVGRAADQQAPRAPSAGSRAGGRSS